MKTRSYQTISKKAILLDGSHANDSTGERARATLTAELQTRGWDVEHIVLREKKIGNCAGDFFCWIRTPGVCNVNDHNRAMAAAIVASDLMVYLTPVTFGGYSSALKRMVDHQMQKWLNELHVGQSSQTVKLPVNGETGNGMCEIRRALLLVGSPKTRKSTSNSLGGYLFERLSAQSIQTETIYLHTVLRSPTKMQALLDAVDAADLVTLAFPLYVDSLPAPVIEALERIALHREGRDRSRRQLFTAIANCGFPEAYQCATALAICETFARQTGFEWAGALALGGGQMLNGVPLVEGGGMTILMRQSLELAAKGLVEGSAIPKAAGEGLAKPIIPRWMYWLTGWLRWIKDAKGYGALKLLYRKPYLAKAK